MAPSLSVIGGFFLRALFFLAPALALWYWAREYVVAPVAWFAERAMLHFFPGWVLGTELDGTVQFLHTTLRVADELGRVGELSADANILIFCYGLPLFVALLAAARARGMWWKIPLGAAVLVPFQAWGVCFKWLVQIAVHAGQVTQAATGFSALQVNLIAIAAQLGYLLMPTLIPLLLWLHFERRFVTTVAIDGAMQGSIDFGQRR